MNHGNVDWLKLIIVVTTSTHQWLRYLVSRACPYAQKVDIFQFSLKSRRQAELISHSIPNQSVDRGNQIAVSNSSCVTRFNFLIHVAIRSGVSSIRWCCSLSPALARYFWSSQFIVRPRSSSPHSYSPLLLTCRRPAIILSHIFLCVSSSHIVTMHTSEHPMFA